MRIPESHIDIVNENTLAVLSTINNSEVYSAFCTIKNCNEKIILDTIDEEQINHIKENKRVSILTIDPANMGHWFCIQGTTEFKNNENANYSVKIKKIILFPKI